MGELHDARRAHLHRRRRLRGRAPAMMRRALEYAAALPGAVVAQHAEDPALVAGGHMHEGEWSSRLGIPGRPRRPRSMIVARDLELSRGHRRPLPRPAHVDGGRGRPGARRQGARVCRSRPRRRRSTSPSPTRCCELRPGVQDEPAAAHRRRRRRASSPAWPTARSTPSRPTTPRTPPVTKERPSRRRRRGCSGVETALAVTLTELVEPGSSTSRTLLARLSWQPAAIAGLDAARRRPTSRAGRRREPLRPRPGDALGGRRRRAGQPVAQHALRRAQAHRAGPPHDLPRASWSSSTARQPGDATASGRRDGEETRRSVLADGDGVRGGGDRRAPSTATRWRRARSCSTPRCRGYQEIVTDPSYAGQVITFTYPHIGNYGTNADDDESARPVLLAA